MLSADVLVVSLLISLLWCGWVENSVLISDNYLSDDIGVWMYLCKHARSLSHSSQYLLFSISRYSRKVGANEIPLPLNFIVTMMYWHGGGRKCCF